MAEQSGVPAKTALWIIGGIVAVVVLIAVFASGGDDDGPALPSITTTTTTEAPADDPPAPDGGTGSELDPLNCARLLSNEEAVLALEEDDPDGEIYSAFTFTRGEFCAHEHADDSRNYVLLEPTTPDDFAPDATRLDAAPERVEGIGEAAVWFGGEEAGSLSVAADSEFGTILYRIEFGRIGITDERRLEHATDLARIVLPRFPGIVLPPPPEPERIEFERPEPEVDRASSGLLDNLLIGVEDGRWSEFDGLVASLEYLVGDSSGDELLPADGVVGTSAAGLAARAAAYAETAAEDEAARIDQLLDRLFPTPDLPDPEPQAAVQRAQARANRSAAPVLVQEDEESPDCDDGEWADGICAEVSFPTPAGDELPAGKYVVHAPRRDFLPQAGITEEFLDEVREGMTNAALLLDPLGEVPDVIVFVTDITNNVEVLADPRLHGTETCAVFVYAAATELPPAELRQWIAFEMSTCFLLRIQPERVGEPFEPDAWVTPSAQYYLSAVAEPDGYLESVYLQQFRKTELVLPLEQRRQENAFFFLWLHGEVDAPGVVSLIQTTPPTGDLEDVAAALAADEAMDARLHEFARAVADRSLIDGAGRDYAEQPIAVLTLIARTGAFIDYDLDRLGADRIIVNVPEGSRACLAFEPRGDLRTGWRPFEEPGGWTTQAPTEIEGEWMLTTTSVAEGSGYFLTVDRVIDADESCTEDPPPEEDPSTPDPIEVELCLEECGSSGYPHSDLPIEDLIG